MIPAIEQGFLTSLSRAAVSPRGASSKRGTYDRAPHIAADRGGPRRAYAPWVLWARGSGNPGKL